MTLEEAMEREILSSLDVYLLKTNTVVSDIEILSNREYRKSDLRKYFATAARNALAVGMIAGIDKIPSDYKVSKEQKEEIEKIHNKIAGKRTAIFAVDIEHAEELAEELRNQGVSASAVHSRVDVSTRGKILQSHMRGETQVVTGVDMLSIGWDSPKTEVGIYLRPTYSGVVAVQSLGRILRPSPETGKEEAIAIQLVDQFARRVNSPVLIPHIFDPEYVLRGSQTGEKPSGKSSTASKEKPLVSFSGMNIESIIEEAKSKEILKRRFAQGSIGEISGFVDKLIEETQEKYPDVGLYQLFKIITDELPEKLPAQAQEKSIQAAASLDTNTRRLGQKTFLLLNMKTILTVVDSNYAERFDSKEDREEMLSNAIVSVLEKLSDLSPNMSVSQQVHRAAGEGVAEYLSQRDNMPASWVRRGQATRLIIATKINEAFGQGNRILTNEEINNLAKTLSEETGINENNLKHYINYRNSLRVDEDVIQEDDTFKEVSDHTLKEDVKNVLETLPERKYSDISFRRILELRFGLEDDETRTLEAIGREFGLTPEAIRSAEGKALRELYHPKRARKLRDYI